MNTQKAFDSIPVKPYGWTPEDDKRTNQLRCAMIAKRAVQAAYKDENEPELCISDLLADLRHLCDALGLDFAELDSPAYDNYTEEKDEDIQRKRKGARK